MSIQDLVDCFCANNGLVASTQPERLQRAFDVLTGLFNEVGLSTNTQKTVITDFQTYHARDRMLMEAEERRTMVTGTTFWERHQRRVKFP